MSDVANRDPRTYAIIGAGFEVHKTLGGGFLEAAYGDALAVELEARSIPFTREQELPILYKGVASAHRLPGRLPVLWKCHRGA
jgi:GxxExxY protein